MQVTNGSKITSNKSKKINLDNWYTKNFQPIHGKHINIDK